MLPRKDSDGDFDASISMTISAAIASHARRSPAAAALLAPDRRESSYSDLRHQSEYVVGHLNGIGVGRNDRVAVVLANGPELASAFISVAAAATCAPLNPDYCEAEFDFFLSDLDARALLIRHAAGSPARDVARKRGIPIVELFADKSQPAGTFSLAAVSPASAVNLEPVATGFARPEDDALVLHTSGTTSRPKLVALTHANLLTSADNVRKVLELTPADRCLNVMPLFHIHGLVAGVLASLAAGAGIVCTPGWNQTEFFHWLATFRPTWYTAVPTIHQSVLAASRQGVPSRHSLRLIRSSSASLPPVLLHGLEGAFNVPVIEAYGMTEASHQMCSNPLPPAERKPGSVGLPAGPDVAVIDEAGNLQGTNVIGEIVIRGGNVTSGYENNPAANQAAFTNGWFRTGDQGYRDQDGYFFLTGRLKELINRGGEKISPREVDEALLAHPAVAQAVAFAVPHPRLGEDIAAAVVLRTPLSATDRELRDFLLERLTAHKVPSRFVFVDAIPKGPTGKLQRIGLFEVLAPLLRVDFMPPEKPIEEAVAHIWREVLEIDKVGTGDNFFYIGGDSLLATRVAVRLRAVFEIEVTVEAIFRAPTIAEQALLIEESLVAEVEALPENEIDIQ